MATIPLQLAQRSLDTGNVVQYPQGGEIGRAIEGAGNELSQLAANVQQKQKQQEAFDAKIKENEFQADMATTEDLAAQNAPADGSGIHDSVYGQIDPVTQQAVKPGAFDKQFDATLAKMPESQRADFAAKRELYRKEGSGRMATVQYNAQQKYYDVEIAKQQNQTLTSIAATDPNDTKSIAALKKQGLDFIEASPKPAIYKDAAKADWLAKSEEAAYQGRLAKDPSYASQGRADLGLAPRSGVVSADVPPEGAALLNTIAGTESAGAYNIINGGEHFSSYADHPKKGQHGSVGIAAGRYQFLPSTWERAKAATGVSDFSPANQDKAAWWLAQNDYKQNTGRDLLTDLKSPDANVQAGIRHALSSTWEGLKSMGDGNFANKIAAGPGKSPAPNPEYANIPLDRRLTLANQADVQARQQEATQVATEKADYSAYKDHFELGIVQGQIADPALISGDKTLNDGDKASLLRSWNTQNNDNAGVDAIIGAIGAGQKVAINPFDASQSKIGDKAYTQFIAGVPPDRQVQAANTYSSATGYVPGPVQATLRQGAASTNPQQFADAMSRADTLQRAAPTSFNNFDGGKDVRDNLATFQHLVNDRGMSPLEAARKAIEMNDPANVASRAVLKPKVEAFLKNLSVGDVTNAFDTFTGPGGEPGAGLLPTQQNALLAEYKSLAEDRFYETGDAGTAKAQALADIKRTWGASDISGSTQLMRLPPEQHYPPSGGSFDYLREDALATAKDYVAKTFASPLPADVKWPSAQQVSALKLTPQEQHLYQHHIDNLNNGKFVRNDDGSVSTVFQTSIDIQGKTYNFPTVWDGKILPPDQAADRAIKEKGLDYWPSYANPDAAETRYQAMHTVMEGDIQTLDQLTKPSREVENVTITAGAGQDNSWSTRGDIEAGRPPRYQLWYTYTQDGQQMSDVVLGAPWGLSKADIDTAVAKGQAALGVKATAASAADNANNDAAKAQDAAAEKALKDTVGPAWMKARAAEAAREQLRMQQGEQRMKPKPDPGANIHADIPDPSEPQTSFGSAM